MPTARLLGADATRLDEVSVIGEGPAAIAISRGGASKNYPHKDPNEDAAAFVVSEHGGLAVVADGHAGRQGAEVAVARILEHHAPRWLGSGDVASVFVSEAAEVVADVNRAMVQAALDNDPEPSRSTLSLALVRPGDDFAAALSVGDSHVFRLGETGAEEWIPQTSARTLYLGEASHDPARLEPAVRASDTDLTRLFGLILATDGLSELGIGVEDPELAVGLACKDALAGDPDRVPVATARGVVERALEAQRTNRAGDNAASAVLWWDLGA